MATFRLDIVVSDKDAEDVSELLHNPMRAPSVDGGVSDALGVPAIVRVVYDPTRDPDHTPGNDT